MKKISTNNNQDDGHTIADMSQVERPNLFTFRFPKDSRMVKSQPQRAWEDHELSSKERFYIILGALKATLFIGLAYVVGFGILILLIYLLVK